MMDWVSLGGSFFHHGDKTGSASGAGLKKDYKDRCSTTDQTDVPLLLQENPPQTTLSTSLTHFKKETKAPEDDVGWSWKKISLPSSLLPKKKPSNEATAAGGNEKKTNKSPLKSPFKTERKKSSVEKGEKDDEWSSSTSTASVYRWGCDDENDDERCIVSPDDSTPNNDIDDNGFAMMKKPEVTSCTEARMDQKTEVIVPTPLELTTTTSSAKLDGPTDLLIDFSDDDLTTKDGGCASIRSEWDQDWDDDAWAVLSSSRSHKQ
jgi:hypothetical protein